MTPALEFPQTSQHMLPFQLNQLHSISVCSLTDMASSSTSSRAVFVWTFVLFTTFCYGVRAAPEAFSRRQSDFNILIPPAVLQELQEFGLTENMLQVSHENRCN